MDTMSATDAGVRIRGRKAPATTSRVPHNERTQQFLDSAAALIRESGFESVTMESVAAKTGTNKAITYRHFANRGELLLALFEREVAELDRSVVGALEAPGSYEERSRAAVHAWFECMSSRGRVLAALLDAKLIERQIAKRYRRRQDQLFQYFGRAFAKHYRLDEDTATDAAAILIAGLMGALERWVHAPGDETRRRLEDTYVSLQFAALEGLAHQRRHDR
jgi:AcrR family transcriptional regulator